MSQSTIAVVGSGTMGGGIAHQMALSGFNVKLADVNESALEEAVKRMTSWMALNVRKGAMTQLEADDTLGRVKITTNLKDLSDCSFALEAVFENLEVKEGIFSQLDKILPPDAIIATNTSSMSITALAEYTGRQKKVVGMHFFNPPQIMKLVEVVRGFKTDDDTIKQTMELSRALGKEPIEIKRDTPGFIVNRLLIPQLLEAVRLVEEGVATPEDVDKAIRLGLNSPMGPFELQDYTGVDIGLNVVDHFYEEFRNDRWAAPLSLRALVRAGRLGRKTGAGWYDYPPKDK
ncbi:MAG: 3-hydroxyacyl-CoA dehydrogenase family protein [Actinomycetota bacterium]|nr:3-hydroxyacyl-CoA dehydrogenase family protein [Actinomycetota bacterium]